MYDHGASGSVKPGSRGQLGVYSVDDVSTAGATQLNETSSHRHLPAASELTQDDELDSDWSGDVKQVWSGDTDRLPAASSTRLLDGRVWPEQHHQHRVADYSTDASQVGKPQSGRSQVEEMDEGQGLRDGPVPLGGQLTGTEDHSDHALETKSPVTVCHVRVTVRHRSPRRTAREAITARAHGDTTPVPVLRRAGAPSRRLSPAHRRRVTFFDDRCQAVFTGDDHASSPHNMLRHAPVDTLWHYHDSYPCLQSRHVTVERSVARSLGSSAADENVDNGAMSRELTARVDVASTCQETQHPSCSDTDDEQQQQQQQQQQEQTSSRNGFDEWEETSVSIKQLVESFEKMTCPYMRAPVVLSARED